MNYKSILSLALVLCLSVGLSAQKDAYKKVLNKLDGEINKMLKAQKGVGLSVAVVHGNDVLYCKGFGYANLEKKQKVDENTIFAIGSCSKAFTSALMGKLEADDKLDIDDLAVEHLPSLKFKDPILASQVTIRDIMCHRTGLPRYDYSWYLSNATPEELLSRVQYMDASAPLRTKWQYNNFMFVAQGLIAERYYGKSWHKIIAEEFFAPLGMKNSTSDIDGIKNHPNHSQPYGLNADQEIEELKFFDIMGMGAAGSINSSAQEMTNWLKVWINGGKLGDKEIIPANFAKEAYSSQMIVNSSLPGKESDVMFTTYGFAWMMHSYRGHYVVEHGGNIDGFTANTAFLPADSLGIVILSNQDGSALQKTIRNTIIDRLFGLEKIDWNAKVVAQLLEMKVAANKAKEVENEQQIKGTKTTLDTENYLGTFNHPAYFNVEITKPNDSIFAQIGKYKILLTHYHYDVFVGHFPNAKGEYNVKSDDIFFNYRIGNNGKLEGFETFFTSPEDTYMFKRLDVAKEIDSKSLAAYLGDYELGPQKIKVKDEDGVLVVSITGQPDYKTTFIGKHTFKLALAEGYSIVFKMDGDKASEMTFNQPNGAFTAKRK